MAKRYVTSAANREAKAHREVEARRQKALRTWALVAVLAVVGAIIGAGIGLRLAAPAQGPRAAPDFTVTDINGIAFSLSAQRGKVVLLDFMGVNCPPCRVEMPHLVATYNALQPMGLLMISIDVGFPQLTAQGPGQARDFMNTFGARWPIALEGGSTAGAAFGVNQIPNFFIVDKQGMIRFHPQQFPVSEADFEAAITPLLAE